MSLKLKIINPISYPGWDDLLLSSPEYSFFHSSAWARVLQEVYHYKPLYFTLINDGSLLVSIPIMEIRNVLTGQKGVSLPFTDYCDPIVTGDVKFQDVIDCLFDYGKQTGWKFIEMRCGEGFFQGMPPSSYYYGHTLDLSQNEEVVFSNFRDSTKGNIKKALRKGVKINISNSLESINEFYRLNCMTRRRHGLPPQPGFFLRIFLNILYQEVLVLLCLLLIKKRLLLEQFISISERK